MGANQSSAEYRQPSTEAPPAAVWVAQFGDLLFRYALLRVVDRGAAEELVQETFLAALQGRDKFKGQSEFSTWLVGILKYKILDHFRRGRRNQTETLPEDPVVDAMFSAHGKWKKFPRRWHVDPQDSAMDLELLPALERCMEALPESQRQAFVLSVMDDEQPTVVCKMLGISSTNFYVLLHRARLRLRDCLEKKGFGQSDAMKGG
ncbi:MAG: sigma-70 family RNA polymerase sigma factor [Phycisphaerae bacterium]|nr:sigma-70 family RNA polymerase sigma factor [Phycisphaerae bacterium]